MLRKKIEGGIPERVKKTKCGGGVLRKKFEGRGMPKRVKKTKWGGGCKIKLRGVCLRGGG